MSVRILNAGLDEDEGGEIIIRGTIDQATLKFINIAWYQREQGFSNRHTQEIVAGFLLNPRMADITIGMRGTRCQSRTEKGSTTYLLHDKCYCIDGGQRLYAAALALRERPDLNILLGAKVYTNTTEETENEMFCKLGTTQVRVAVSVLLRNKKKKSQAAAALVALNRDDKFALKDRIAWDQVRTRRELMTGFTLARIAGTLHAHKMGGLRGTKLDDLVAGLDLLIETIGIDTFRTNIVRFFDAIDACWSMRHLSGARDEERPHLKSDFLITIAMLLSRYSEFWDGKPRNEFYFGDKYVKLLRGFKLADYIRTSPIVRKDVLLEVLRQKLRLDPMFKDQDEEAA